MEGTIARDREVKIVASPCTCCKFRPILRFKMLNVFSRPVKFDSVIRIPFPELQATSVPFCQLCEKAYARKHTQTHTHTCVYTHTHKCTIVQIAQQCEGPGIIATNLLS